MKALALAVTVLAVAAMQVRAAAPETPANTPGNLSATATVQPSGGTPSERNPLLADNGAVRTSKLNGTTVYNRQDQKLGSIDDVLIGTDGQPEVIVSTSDKLVSVPWSKLQFGNAKLNSHNKVILPDETLQSLKQLPAFKYAGKG